MHVNWNFKSFVKRYLDDHSQINLIALQTSLIGGGLALFYVCCVPTLEVIVIIIGSLSNSMMLSATYHNHNSIQRLRYGLICAIGSGLAFGIGSWTQSNLFLSSLAFLFLLPLIGFGNNKHNLIMGLLAYTVTGFILGGSVMTTTAKSALSYALCYFLGGGIMIISGMLRILIRKKLLNLTEDIAFIQDRVWFSLTRKNLLFTCNLLISVLICNYIAVKYHLDHGYWLTLTAFLLIKNDQQLTVQRSLQRVVGTLLGGGLALGFCWLVQDKFILALILVPMLYLTIIAISRHYGSFTLFLTISISMLIGLQDAQAFINVKYRILYTIIAVSIVMLCIHTIQPLTTQILRKMKTN